MLRPPKREGIREGDMQSAFESWVGQHVVVRLTLGKTKVSLRGILLKEGPETLLMGPEFGSELEIPKKIILAIEEVGAARLPVPLAPSGISALSVHFRNTSSRPDTVGTSAFKSFPIVGVQESPPSEAVLTREGDTKHFAPQRSASAGKR